MQSLREFSGASMGQRLAVYGRRFGWVPESNFAADFHARLFQRLSTELLPVSGASEALNQLQIPFCVASNGTWTEIEQRLVITGLIHHFGNRLYSAADLNAPKPAPDVFLAAAAACGADPSHCAVVEDSVYGVRAAVAAGMHVFGFSAIADPRALREAGAATVFDEWRHLPQLLSAETSVGTTIG
ncbi:MAG: HAD family hydrolase [Vulcanimicrobiaceae bacterium]